MAGRESICSENCPKNAFSEHFSGKYSAFYLKSVLKRSKQDIFQEGVIICARKRDGPRPRWRQKIFSKIVKPSATELHYYSRTAVQNR